MCRHTEDCDQVSGHCSNTVQGQAWWKCQRHHLLDTSAAEGLGTDQCWAEMLAFQRACQLRLRLQRKGHTVVGSKAPSGPSVLGGYGKSSCEV